MDAPFAAVDTTQWIIAIGSLSSALIALALALGLREWFVRPRVRLELRRAGAPDEEGDRVVTTRIDGRGTAAFVRVRLVNHGRSTARNVAVALLGVHRRDQQRGGWVRARPELDGRLLQPANQLPSQSALVDVFPGAYRILDLASVDLARVAAGRPPLIVEIEQPWPPNEANVLEAGTWRLEVLVCGDNVPPERSFLTLAFDGAWPEPGSPAVWEHFRAEGPTARAGAA